MGVKNLWDILESCKKTLPLHHLQNKRVCIGLSCWMVQLQNVSKSHSCIKQTVYLRGLFHRLRALIAVNCTIVFVTDGSIPAIKLSTYRRHLNSGSEVTQDDRNFQNVTSLRRNMGSEFSYMIKEAKVLGMALGIPCLDGMDVSFWCKDCVCLGSKHDSQRDDQHLHVIDAYLKLKCHSADSDAVHSRVLNSNQLNRSTPCPNPKEAEQQL